MAVTFRYANADEYPRIADFLDQYWAKDHIYVRDKPLFDWTFGRLTHWEESGYCFALGEDNGELVGILGGIPFLFNSFGKSEKGIWIANYVIRPDYRKGTTALQLLSVFRNMSRHAVVASGINPATSTIYKVLRGEVLPYIPRRFAVFPEGAERMVNLLRIAYPDWDAPRAQSLAQGLRVGRFGDAAAKAGDALPGNWDKIDWPAIAEKTIGAARDSDYLTWRYLQHPRFTYRFITIGEGERTGLLVWRLETIKRATEQGRVDVERIARIVELLPVSAENAQRLLSTGMRQMSEAGAFGADFYGYHSQTNSDFDNAGFVYTTKLADGEHIPSRFQPLDGKGGGILSAMFLREKAPAFQESDCPWYWTKSDSDQDRPN
jgi:hypothetical protein